MRDVAERQRDRETARQRDRETERQRDRETACVCVCVPQPRRPLSNAPIATTAATTTTTCATPTHSDGNAHKRGREHRLVVFRIARPHHAAVAHSVFLGDKLCCCSFAGVGGEDRYHKAVAPRHRHPRHAVPRGPSRRRREHRGSCMTGWCAPQHPTLPPRPSTRGGPRWMRSSSRSIITENTGDATAGLFCCCCGTAPVCAELLLKVLHQLLAPRLFLQRHCEPRRAAGAVVGCAELASHIARGPACLLLFDPPPHTHTYTHTHRTRFGRAGERRNTTFIYRKSSPSLLTSGSAHTHSSWGSMIRTTSS